MSSEIFTQIVDFIQDNPLYNKCILFISLQKKIYLITEVYNKAIEKIFR